MGQLVNLGKAALCHQLSVLAQSLRQALRKPPDRAGGQANGVIVVGVILVILVIFLTCLPLCVFALLHYSVSSYRFPQLLNFLDVA